MENESENLEVGADETEEVSSSVPQDETSDGYISDEGENNDSSEAASADQTDSEGDLQSENGEPLDGEGDLTGEDEKLLEEGDKLQEAAGASLNITSEELHDLIYGSIEEYFSNEIIKVCVQEKGIDTPLDELGLTDALIFVLVIIALGHAISEIIGGKLKWRK